jgi:hypothetical protein
MEDQEVQDRFLLLVEEYRLAAWIGLGKLKDPASGDVRRDLGLARHAIDTLGMLEQKTRGNLAAAEERFLRQALTDLRLNFVEEMNRPEAAADGAAAGGPAPSSEAASAPERPGSTGGAGGS